MANEVRYDVDGYDVVTRALLDLLNEYPALPDGETFKFAVLSSNTGKAVFPLSGAVIQRENRDILGRTTQICLYPLRIVYRAGATSETRKQAIKEWLDDLGRWLEKQPITVNGTTYKIDEYPALTGQRKFEQIYRTTPSALEGYDENNVEDWALTINARYRNEF